MFLLSYNLEHTNYKKLQYNVLIMILLAHLHIPIYFTRLSFSSRFEITLEKVFKEFLPKIQISLKRGFQTLCFSLKFITISPKLIELIIATIHSTFSFQARRFYISTNNANFFSHYSARVV